MLPVVIPLIFNEVLLKKKNSNFSKIISAHVIEVDDDIPHKVWFDISQTIEGISSHFQINGPNLFSFLFLFFLDLFVITHRYT